MLAKQGLPIQFLLRMRNKPRKVLILQHILSLLHPIQHESLLSPFILAASYISPREPLLRLNEPFVIPKFILLLLTVIFE